MDFPVWMEVEVGGYTKDAFLCLVEVDGHGFGGYAKSMMKHEKFTTLPEKRIVKIARCKPTKLGCTKDSTFCQLKQAVKKVGELCPCELGPRLREKIVSKSEGEEILVIMDPILNPNEDPCIFRIMQLPGTRAQGQVIPGLKVLHGVCMFPCSQINPDADIVFVLPEKGTNV